MKRQLATAKELLSLSLGLPTQSVIEVKICEGTILQCAGIIQHGDLSFGNILFTHNSYVVFDFDTINVFPAFYDFFRMMLIDLKEIGLDSFFDSFFDDVIFPFASLREKSSVISTKDKYLAVFLAYTKDRWPINWLRIDLLPDGYSLTREFLKNR